MNDLFYTLFLLLVIVTSAPCQHTRLSIRGENFYINNRITLKNKTYQGISLAGLLPNSRMVQGIYDDSNPLTKDQWKYPDTQTWDPDRNTNEFIQAMPDWYDHGLLAVTLNLQGGSPQGYSQYQPWINSAFLSDGSLDTNYMKRLARIIHAADRQGMIVILGYFYFGQDQVLKDEAAVKNGVTRATHWVLDHNFKNVIIEINNECDINDLTHPATYNYAILDVKRVVELIQLVKSIKKGNRRLLVSTSFKGGAIPTDDILDAGDVVLIHGNSVRDPAVIGTMVKTIRSKSSYHGVPIIFNEDDHFDFDQPMNNFIAATAQHASWGYFDYRMKGESFEDGYQSVPVDWRIQSPRKKAFFDLLKRMTKKN